MRATRGAALLAVLFVLLICELAIFVVTSEIHHIARRFVSDRDRTAACRLAESGVEHALAAIAAGGAWAGSLEGSLAEGGYEVTLVRARGDALELRSRGRALGGSEVELQLVGRVAGGVFVPAARSWRSGPRQ